MTITTEANIISLSKIYSPLDCVHFKWNRAGNVNAVGVNVNAPVRGIHESNLSPSAMVIAIIMHTINARVAFLLQYLFLDGGYPSNI